jgi:D-arabinose 1-dehydrogenase-like Zn-dependent alcohol dehydrogenase
MAPSQMKALVAAAAHTTEVKTISVPKPGAGEVLIKVRRLGRSGGVQALTSYA